MSLAHLFVSVGETPLGLFMRDSTWAFAAVEAAHLLGLAVLGGTVMLLGLASCGLALRRQSLAVTAAGLAPLFTGGLAVMLATGALLVASKPFRYYLSDPFRAKMLLLVFGVLLYIFLHRMATGRRRASEEILKIAGSFLILSWLGVGLAGRLIGLF